MFSYANGWYLDVHSGATYQVHCLHECLWMCTASANVKRVRIFTTVMCIGNCLSLVLGGLGCAGIMSWCKAKVSYCCYDDTAVLCIYHLSDACDQCWMIVECNTLLLCEYGLNITNWCSENRNWFSEGSLQHHHNHGLLKRMVSQAMPCAMLCPWQACLVNVVIEWDQSL